MAVAFNANEEREGGNNHNNQNAGGNSPPSPPPAYHQLTSTTSNGSSANSSVSSSATSSTNSSPGAVTAPMAVPQSHHHLHHPYAAPNAVYYYQAAGSPSVPPPPHSPATTATIYRQYNNEELIQAICEALQRCSTGSLPPPSPSCNPYNPANVPLTPYAVYGGGQQSTSNASAVETNVFFPQNMPTTPHAFYAHPQQPPQTPISHSNYYSVPPQQQQQQQQPLYFQYHSVPYATPVTPSHLPQTFEAAPAQTPVSTVSQQQPQQVPRRAARRIRLSSRSEANTSVERPIESSESETDLILCNDLNNYTTIVDANNNHSASSDSDNPLYEHLNYLEARERLEEFPGRVPQRRKKSSSANSSSGSSKKISDIDGVNSVITSQKQQNRHSSDSCGNDTVTPVQSSRSQPGSSGSSSSNSGRSASQKSRADSGKEIGMNLSLLSALMVLGVSCVGCVFFTSR